jgi:hypothetical protein
MSNEQGETHNMVLRRILGRKKDEDEDKKDDAEVVEESVEAEEVVEAEETETPEEDTTEITEEEPFVEESVEDTVEVTDTAVAGTLPYHDSFKDRLMYLINETAISSTIEAPDSFCLEFMAMGERFTFEKESMGDIEIKSGTAKNTDVHIRIANDTINDLLSASTYDEFKEIFLNFYRNPEAGRFVKIEMYEDVSNLNRRGYARVPLLKLLIGAAR